MRRKDMQSPHCDSRVLHAPGECEYCDRHPDWQELRDSLWRINFTGHHEPDKAPCPAEAARGMDSLNRWGGNIPIDVEAKQARKQYWKDVRRLTKELMQEQEKKDAPQEG